MGMTAGANSERFRSEAHKYAAYLDTPEGRLRTDLTFANLEDFLPRLQVGNSLRALDVGCGTGAAALRLARRGIQVTLLDSSEAMLEIAKRAAHDAEVTERVAWQHGDAVQLASLFPARSFDLILCHNILEYVEDPLTVLRGAARALRNDSAIVSVLVRNRAGEVFKAAIQAGDLKAAENGLTGEWGQESLYGGTVRLFSSEGLREMLKKASLATIAERGVRVLADYLPPGVSRNAEYERIFDLERKLGKRPEFAGVARYTHVCANRPGPFPESGT